MQEPPDQPVARIEPAGAERFVLAPGEPLGPGFTRVMEDLAEYADSWLDVPVSDTGVHESRKAMKKGRAVLRSVRSALPGADYARINAALRDGARALSPARDAAVMRELLILIDGEDGGDERTTVDAWLLDNLERKRSSLSAGVVTGIRSRLAEVAAWLGQGSMSRLEAAAEIDALLPGITKVYRSARRRMRHAVEAGTTEAFHEWRKQVKYLRYQAEVLAGSWPGAGDPETFALKELAESLGEEHDLAVLAGVIYDQASGEWADATLASIVDRRNAVQRHAITLGGELLEPAPKDFAASIAEAWSSWRSAHPIG